MSDPTAPNPNAPLVSTENIFGAAIQVGIPNQGDPGNSRCPNDLVARSWPEGKRIDLVWTLPEGITWIIIKRSQTAHSAFLTDQAEVIYNGPAIDHFIDGVPVAETVGKPGELYQAPPDLETGIPNTGVELREDAYYYYTLYMTTGELPVGLLDFGEEAHSCCQVTGLSGIDYLRSTHDENGNSIPGRGEYLYRMIPEETRAEDQRLAELDSRATGYLQDYCRFIQGGINLARMYTKGLEQLGDPDTAPAGLVGRAFDQATILKNWARRFNISPERYILDVAILRRIAQGMIFIYKEKGTCPSIVDFTKLLTLWDSSCSEFGSDLTECNPFFLQTWGGVSRKQQLNFLGSLVTITAGKIELAGGGLTPNEFAAGLIIGPTWDQFAVKDNTASTINLEDETAVMSLEDILSISVVTPVAGSIYDLTVTRTSGGPVEVNDAEYDRLKILDSANTLMTVVSTTSPGTIQVDSPILPVTGVASASRNIIPGATYGDRDVVFVADLRTRCPTFLYDPLKNLDLKGADFDPHDVLFDGGSLFGIPFFPGDVILKISAGVAEFVGKATAVSGNVLTDSAANFGAAGTLSFFSLNPNHNQKGVFKIVGNTATTITVESPTPGVTLESVAREGSEYFILSLENRRKYELLTRLIQLMLPSGNRIFIQFE